MITTNSSFDPIPNISHITVTIGNETERDSDPKVHTVAKLIHKGEIQSSTTPANASLPLSTFPTGGKTDEEIFRDKVLNLLRKTPSFTRRMKNDPIRQLYHIGLKGSVDSEVGRLEEFYGGQFDVHHAYVRLKNALEFLEELSSSADFSEKSKEEISSLMNLCKHRLNFYEISIKLNKAQKSTKNETQLNNLISEIQTNIELLDDPTSDKVVSFSNGSTFFSIPGGSESHFVSYEFKKEAGTPPLYFFVIHNRGEMAPVGEELHGSFSINIDGKEYVKTTLPIQVSKEYLKNSEFIKALIKGRGESLTPYDAIKKFLLDQGGGKIIENEEEKIIKKLQNMLTNPTWYSLSNEEIIKIKEHLYELVKSNENIHSKQILDTCTESNQTQFEKSLASSKIRRELKLFTLKNITNELMTKIKVENAPIDRSAVFFKIGLVTKDYSSYVHDAGIIMRHIKTKKIELRKKQNVEESSIDIQVLKRNSKALIGELSQRFTLETITPELITQVSDFNAFLKELPRGFEDNKEFMIKLIKNSPSPKALKIIRLATERLRNDADFMLAVIKKSAKFFSFASDNLKNNEVFIISAAKANQSILKNIPMELKSNPNIFLELIEVDVGYLKYASEDLKRNRTFILSAIQKNRLALDFASEELQMDEGLQSLF